MSIFNLFSRHPQTPLVPEEKSNSVASSKKSQEADSDLRSEHTKARHLRRDQVFLAIREAMTRTGILPTNYKFKVLSEDPQGNDFLVMMSLVVAGDSPPSVNEMETSIMEIALARFQIIVSAVYWRMIEPAPAPASVPVTKPMPPVVASPAPPTSLPVKPKSPHDTIAADEVIAFQQALLAASAQGQTTPQEKFFPRRRANLPKDFEDTEMVEPSIVPVVSKTQYGDL